MCLPTTPKLLVDTQRSCTCAAASVAAVPGVVDADNADADGTCSQRGVTCGGGGDNGVGPRVPSGGGWPCRSSDGSVSVGSTCFQYPESEREEGGRREGETDRQRQTNGQTDRQTERQRQKYRERQRDRDLEIVTSV